MGRPWDWLCGLEDGDCRAENTREGRDCLSESSLASFALLLLLLAPPPPPLLRGCATLGSSVCEK